MLTVPALIKSLFMYDGVRKNFRVHFPNGEFADITNENIVQESLKFTESLCSQSVFKFGLAEASVIEFETVGVGNMYGMTIEASIEIDTSSLSAANITTIQSNPGDGTLVLAADSDLGYGFYRVPLGKFRVEKCPRNHGAMTHRQVVAYSVDLITDVISPCEAAKMRANRTAETMPYQSVDSLIYANIGWLNSKFVTDNFTKTTVTGSLQTSISDQVSYTIDGYTLTIGWTYSRHKYEIQASSSDTFWCAEKQGFDSSDAAAWVKETLESLNLGEYYEKAYKAKLKSVFNFIGGGIYTSNNIPIRLVAPSSTDTMYCPLYVSFQIWWNKTGQSFSDAFTLYQGSPYKVSTLAYSTTPSAIGITFKPTGQHGSYYTYVGAYSMKKLLPGWLELSGLFGSGHRGLGFKLFSLPSTYASIPRSAYSECWWDEYDVSPVGVVTATFVNGDAGEGTYNIEIGDGASVYEMKDNALLKSTSISLSDLTTLLSGDFATNAAKVNFTPCDLTMRGYPWIEAGDRIEVQNEDNIYFYSFALRIELSGIQHMQMLITAQGGEITGEA